MRTVTLFLAGLLTALALSLLFSLPVQWLWNWALVPAVEGVREIGWLQAWGLMFLFDCLVKSRVEVKRD